jgi:ribosomal protein L7/L12
VTIEVSDKVRRIREYREKYECGVHEAKRMVEYNDLEWEIEMLETMEDVKTFLRNLLKYVR